jgi:O-antigen/teichoic acid export membrane protein
MIKESVINSPKKDIIKTHKQRKGENLKQRAYLNTVSSLIDYIGAQLTGMIVSPFIVRGLGSSMYGIWQMLGQMTGYAKMADSRATQVLKWTVAKKKAIATEEELRSDLTSALFVTIASMPLVLIIGGVISWYAPYITKADPAYYNLIRIVCSLLNLSLVIAKVFDLYECVLRGMNLGFKRMGFRAGIVAVGGSLKVLAITLGYGLIGLSIVQILITVITGFTFYYIVKKNVGWLGFGKTNFKKVVSFSKLTGWNMANTTTITLLTQSDKVLLGFIASPILVSSYSLTLFLPLAVQGVIFNIIIGAVPGIGKLLGLNEYSKIHKAWSNMNDLIFLLTAAAGVTIILFNNSFLRIWVGEGHFAGNITNALIMLMIIQDLFVRHDGYIITATLDLKKKVYLTIISIIIFTVLAFILIKSLGIAGLCLSLIVSKFLLFIGQRKFLQSKIQYSFTISLFQRAQPLLILLLMLGMACYVSSFIHPVSFSAMVALVPLTFTCSLFIFYAIGLRKEKKNELLQIASSIKLFKSN